MPPTDATPDSGHHTNRHTHGTTLALCVLAFAITFLASALAWQRANADTQAERASRYGATLTTQLAALYLEPLLKQDRVRLGVLANAVTAAPEVQSVAVYTVDDQLLALAGDTAPRSTSDTFSAPVAVDDTIAGFVRVTVSKQAFGVSVATLLRKGWLWWLGVLAAIIAISMFAGLRQGPDGLTRRRTDAVQPSPAEHPTPQQQTVASPSTDIPDTAERAPQPAVLTALVVNLFNQVSLDDATRAVALQTALERVRRVANLYGGRADTLSGTGILLVFDNTGNQDRTFEVVCAALLCVTVLDALSNDHYAQGQPELKFRYAMHQCSPGANFESLIDSEEIHDAVLLSNVAPDATLALSAEVYAAIDRNERVNTRSNTAAAITSLTTTDNLATHLVATIRETYQTLLDQQADLLLAQDSLP